MFLTYLDDSMVYTVRFKKCSSIIQSHFRCHVYCVGFQARRILGLLIRYISYNFSFLDSLVVFYVNAAGSRLEYASAIWNNLRSNQLECILTKVASFSPFRSSFSLIFYTFMI
jgi:hypothetical protein